MDPRWTGDIEARVRALEHEVARIREWKHELSDTLAPIQMGLHELRESIHQLPDRLKPSLATEKLDAKRRAITERDVWIVVAVTSILMSMLAFLGKLQ